MRFIQSLSDALWGMPTALLILGTGLVLSLRTGFLQLRRIREILKSPLGTGPGAFRSLSTALAATVGTGSVVGVGSAIAIGGPGAIFWLWVSAFFGMAVAYAEGVLSIKYRREAPRRGGIWYALEDGLKMKKTAKLYALLSVLTSFGMGCAVQSGAAAKALESEFSLSPAITGGALALLLVLCMFRSGFAGKLCEAAVPFFAGFYVLGALAVIIKNAAALPGVFARIFTCAFGFKQAAGGAAGGFFAALSVGCRRGIFSNEAGLGTTAPVHALSDIRDPDRQGLMNMLEVMIDTFIICTLTALAILCSGADRVCSGAAELVLGAAETAFGGAAGRLVSVSVAFFAAATAIGWSQIGLSAAGYVFPGKGRLFAYKLAYSLSALPGALFALDAVFAVSDIFNALMILPCVSCIVLLRGEIADRGLES